MPEVRGSHTRGLALSMVLVTRLASKTPAGNSEEAGRVSRWNSLAQSLWGLGEEDHEARKSD